MRLKYMIPPFDPLLVRMMEVDFVLPEVTSLGKDGELRCIWNEQDQRPQL